MNCCETGVFDDNRYFDVFVECAKASPNDVLIRITAANRGPEAATLHLLPTLWFRNTWTWLCLHEGCTPEPRMSQTGDAAIAGEHVTLGRFHLRAGSDPSGRVPPLLFTENETNVERLFHVPNAGPYVKDAFHEYVIHGKSEAVNPAAQGTKAAAHYVLEIAAQGSASVDLRLFAEEEAPAKPFGQGFDQVFADRIRRSRRVLCASYTVGGLGRRPPH